MEKWAKANPKLAAAKAERDRTRGTSSTTNPLMADIKSKLPAATPASTSKPGPKEKQNQTPTTGPTPAIPDLKSVNADLKKSNSSQELNKPAPAGSALAKEQERRKKQSSTTATSESYDAYDLVLEYLLSQGHVETVEEANYVMLVMDSETIGSIVEGVMPEPIDPTAHNNSRRFATQQGKIRSLESGAATSGEKSAAQSKLKGPQLPGV
jgi:hypothetical protein